MYAPTLQPDEKPRRVLAFMRANNFVLLLTGTRRHAARLAPPGDGA